MFDYENGHGSSYLLVTSQYKDYLLENKAN